MRRVASSLFLLLLFGAADNLGAFLPTDCSVSTTDGVTAADPGGSVVYTIEAANSGDPSIGTANASLADDFSSACATVSYTSAHFGGATGNTATGTGDVLDQLVMPPGSSVTYTATCTIADAAVGTLVNTVLISCLFDINGLNDGASDTDTLNPNPDLLFVDGFADGKACAWSTFVTQPSSCTNGIHDGCESGIDCGGNQCDPC